MVPKFKKVGYMTYSRDRKGSQIEKVGHVTLPTPPQEAIYLLLFSTCHDPLE